MRLSSLTISRPIHDDHGAWSEYGCGVYTCTKCDAFHVDTCWCTTCTGWMALCTHVRHLGFSHKLEHPARIVDDLAVKLGTSIS